MFEAIVIGVFVFVTITVAGFRAINTLEAHKAKLEAERRHRIASRANRRDYTGQRYNAHGREIEG